MKLEWEKDRKLKNDFGLELSREKTRVTNLKSSKAKFLGFSIYSYRSTQINRNGIVLNRTGGYQILIGIDMDRMIDKLVSKGFCKDSTSHRPIAKGSLSVLTYEQIIDTYNYIMRGMGNYFLPMLSRVKDFIRVVYILEYSAYMTIAKKRSSKISKIREKFGKPLKMEITQKETGSLIQPRSTTKIIQLLDYLTIKKVVKDMLINQRKKNNDPLIIKSDLFNPLNKINWRTLRNLSMACCICGSTENVEMHHVHAIHKGKVVGFTQVLKQLNRKQTI